MHTPCPSHLPRLCLVLMTGLIPLLAAGTSPLADAWRDASKSPELRAEALLAAMTQDERITLVSAESDADLAPLAHLGLPLLRRVDASCGLRGDAGATALPVPISLASSFDRTLAKSYGELIADEAMLKGWNVILGPTLDIARDPLNGRTAEAFGEDPVLSGEMGAAVVNGMQSRPVLSMAKHYTAYHREDDRLTMDVRLSTRALQEVYNRPFDILLDRTRVGALMGSYPRINGTFACENRELLSLITGDARFHGYFATDYEAGADGVAQFNAGIDSWSLQPNRRDLKAFSDGRIGKARLDEAALRILRPVFALGLFDHPLRARPVAVSSLRAHRSLALRAAVAGSVLLKNEQALLPLSPSTRVAVIGPAGADFITGVQGSSYVRPGSAPSALEAISDHAASADLVCHAQGSAGDLPLEPLSPFYPKGHALRDLEGNPGWTLEWFENDSLSGTPSQKRNTPEASLSRQWTPGTASSWSARLSARLSLDSDDLVRFSILCGGTVCVRVDGKSVLSGRRAQPHFFAGDGGPYSYPLQGVARLRAGVPVLLTVEYSSRGAVWSQECRLGWQRVGALHAKAVAAARAAEVAVVIVNEVSGEEMDRTSLHLPGDQEALIEAVAEANPNTLVVLNTPSAVVMPWLSKVRAVLDLWYPGVMGGEALARMLYGIDEPTGRLPLSFPAAESERPQAYDGSGSIRFDEGVLVGYRYLQHKGVKPLFPFGHGLSYSSFEVASVSLEQLPAPGSPVFARVHATLRNPGLRSSRVVLQAYACPPASGAIEMPRRMLAGFSSVVVEAGSSREAAVDIDARIFRYWDERGACWRMLPGNWTIELGADSEHTAACGTLPILSKD